MKSIKLILAVIISAFVFMSCQTSHGCGCLQTDTQTEVETEINAEV